MYSAYEKIGTEKRDLLKSRVKKARDAQAESSEEFKDALTQLKELYGYSGGNLEKAYDEVKGDYEDVSQSAEEVRKSIEKMDQVAEDLFDEWKKEAKEIKTAEYRAESRRQLEETRTQYEAMHTALRRSEKAMEPALAKLKDQVLYLKHNLNARAIGSLKGKGESLQADIDRVLKEVSTSIEKADGFIREMESTKKATQS
jgi:methyl-accepting chemotaxis protein